MRATANYGFHSLTLKKKKKKSIFLASRWRKVPLVLFFPCEVDGAAAPISPAASVLHPGLRRISEAETLLGLPLGRLTQLTSLRWRWRRGEARDPDAARLESNVDIKVNTGARQAVCLPHAHSGSGVMTEVPGRPYCGATTERSRINSAVGIVKTGSLCLRAYNQWEKWKENGKDLNFVWRLSFIGLEDLLRLYYVEVIMGIDENCNAWS